MKKRIALLLWVAVVSVSLTTYLFWHFEHEVNPAVGDYFDVMWWWVVTSATVGYGDIVPITMMGRLSAMLAIVTGFFIYTNLVAIVAESAHEYLERKNKGRVTVKSENHIIICEYTAIADELIQALEHWERFKSFDVVIVTDLVSQNPYSQHSFVSGVPLNPMALRMANIEAANYIFIFANLRFADPDIKTLHVATRVLSLNQKATVFVEMIDPNNDLLKYASNRVKPLGSRKLVEAVLRDGHISAESWEKMCFGS